jgi:hypothetical protein
VLPANAGMIRSATLLSGTSSGAPRECGDDPYFDPMIFDQLPGGEPSAQHSPSAAGIAGDVASARAKSRAQPIEEP